MIRNLLLTLLGTATITATAQLNQAGTGYTLNNKDAASQCLLNIGADNNGGIMSHGTTIDQTDYLVNGGPWVLNSKSDVGTGGSATWFSMPSIDGSDCSTLFAQTGIDMSSDSKISVKAKSSVQGATLDVFIGSGGQWFPTSSTFNTGAGSTIFATATFTAADTEETFTFDFNALDASVWGAWAGKSNIESIGFRSGTNSAVFDILEVKFGSDVVDNTNNNNNNNNNNGGGGTTCTGAKEDHGHGTWYTNLEDTNHPLYTGLVRCSFQRDDIVGTDYGALDKGMLQEDNNAKYCGMCVEATGPAGTATIQIVDECPDCWDRASDGSIMTGTNTKFGDIDLSPSAFQKVVGDQNIGIGDFDWKEVSCPWTSNLHVIVEGSNQWYAKVIIGNHVNRIANVEVQQGGTWHGMTRGDDNGWISTGVSINEASKSFRITDVYGEEVIVSGIDFSADPTNSKTVGDSNFPACGMTTSTSRVNTLEYVSVFPNPASNIISFEGIEDATMIEIVSVNGQVVASTKLNGEGIIKLDISDFAQGIYVAKLTGKANAGTVTFIKK